MSNSTPKTKTLKAPKAKAGIVYGSNVRVTRSGREVPTVHARRQGRIFGTGTNGPRFGFQRAAVEAAAAGAAAAVAAFPNASPQVVAHAAVAGAAAGVADANAEMNALIRGVGNMRVARVGFHGGSRRRRTRRHR